MADPHQKKLDTELAAEAADVSTKADTDESLKRNLTTELQAASKDTPSGSNTMASGVIMDETGQEPGSSSNPTLDHTSDPQENQPERPAARQSGSPNKVSTKPNYDKFPDSLVPRVADVDEQLIAKERLVLSYIYSKVPNPFYERWKHEANDIFCLRVRLKYRSLRS